MSISITRTLDQNQWLRQKIAERWPQTTKESNGGVYLTVALSDMILEGTIGLDREQVVARLDYLRRTHRPLDQYPGHASICESLTSLREATKANLASAANDDFRLWCEKSIKSDRAMVVYDPSILDRNAQVSVTAYTNYCLERAARVLLHQKGRVGNSPDDVHVWHTHAARAPQPQAGDPRFSYSHSRLGHRHRFLLAASNVVGYLGVGNVHWASWVDRGQPRLFEPFQWRERADGDAAEFPCDPDAVRFYTAEDIRDLESQGNTDFMGIVRNAQKQRQPFMQEAI